MASISHNRLINMKYQSTVRPWGMAFVVALLMFGGAAVAQTHQDIHLSNGTMLRIPLADIDSMGFYPSGYATPLTVATGAATVVGANIAEIGGELLTGGPCERGVCWATTPNPTIADQLVSAGTGGGIFTCSLNGLAANTMHYVRAYASNTAGTVYGNVVPFTTDTALFQLGTNVVDAQGNSYPTIWVGGRHWMTKNLRTVTFANGDPIPNVTSALTWEDSTTPARCAFNNLASYAATHGLLYNGYAVVDPRNVCPNGWHVATDVDLRAFVEAIDTVSNTSLNWVNPRAGGMMKATGGVAWQYPNMGASNASGFTALGAGYRSGGNGSFWQFYNRTYFWGLAANTPGVACYYELEYDHGEIRMQNPVGPSSEGYSVRCVAD